MTSHSGLMRRMMMAQVARGTLPLVLGDVTGDMTRLVSTMGGQVVRLGPDLDRINPLDVGGWADALSCLPPELAAEIRDTVIEHRVTTMTTLIGLVRGATVMPEETMVLLAAIAQVTDTEPATKVTAEIADIEHLVREPTNRVRSALAWLEHPNDLICSLQQLLDGDLGDFNGQTSTALQLDSAQAIAINISASPAGQQRAAALAVAWAHGLATADTAIYLGWASNAPYRPVLAIYPDPHSKDHVQQATGFGPGRRGPMTTVPR